MLDAWTGREGPCFSRLRRVEVGLESPDLVMGRTWGSALWDSKTHVVQGGDAAC